MEKELFFSGYCRAMDQSRMVEVVITDGEVEADCAYPDCPHAPSCQIAQRIKEAEELPGLFRAEQARLCQFSICFPRKPATVWASFWSDSCMGCWFSPISSITQPIRSPWDRMGEATPR